MYRTLILPTLYKRGEDGKLLFWKVRVEGGNVIETFGTDGTIEVTGKVTHVPAAYEEEQERKAHEIATSAWEHRIINGYTANRDRLREGDR